MRKQILLIASLLFIGAGCYAVPVVRPTPIVTVPPAPTLQTYRDAKLKFAVDYGPGITVISDKAAIATSGYIPACDPETAAACFLIPESSYPGKNFQGAGLAVNVIAGAKTEKSCLAPSGNMRPDGIDTVNGVTFASFTDGDAATSHRSDGMDYLAFKDGKCFSLTTRVNTSVFEVYAPGMIQKFTEEDLKSVTLSLYGIFRSFRFE